MSKKIYSLWAVLILLAGCTANSPDIRVVCQRDDIGNYVVKWETYPQIQGVMKLYVSDDPERFTMDHPVVSADITDGRVTYVTNDNVTRKYFLLAFNDKYTKEASSRAVVMDHVQNLRDLGGYQTKGNLTTKWGKIYRSGDLSQMNEWDNSRINRLNIKTIIDLRSKSEVAASPIQYQDANIINIPVSTENIDEVLGKIRSGKLRKGDGLILMQDLYIQFVEKNSEQFGEALQLFLNEENYPIIFNCSLGKDRSGFLAALLLLALDVPESTVMQDYLASNEYLNFKKFDSLVKNLDTEGQETLALLLFANETYMDISLSKIRKEYGSFHNYLQKELRLTDKERAYLKEMLLY